MEEEKLIDSIRPLVEQLHDLHQIQLNKAVQEVRIIVKQGIKDVPRVEKVADMLLESALFGIGLEEFRFFMRYIFEWDAVVAGEYILLYKKWSEEETQDYEE